MRVEGLAARFPFGHRGRNILGAFGYLRIKTSRFVDVGFVLGARKARVVNDRLTETFLLGVNVEGKPLGSDLVVHTDPVWFSRILNMPDWHENHRLSAMAADVLG